MLKINKNDLRNYNGRLGNPAYIAYLGKVYDVSKLFINGEHKGCMAGNDITDILPMMPHGTSVLENFPLVGELEK